MSEQQRPERPPRKNGRPQPGGPNGGAGGPGGGGMRFGRGLFGWVLFIGLAVMLFIVLQSNKKSASEVSIRELDTQADNQNIAELVVDNEVVRGKFVKPVQVANNPNATQFRWEVRAAQVTSSWYMDWVQKLSHKSNNASLRAENNANLVVNLLLPLIPWLLIFAFIWFFVFRQLRNSAGAGGMLGNFGRSKHRITSKEHTNVTFDDVAGIEEAKDEVMEIVEFLKNPKKFQRLCGRISRRGLLVGERDTGKTF